MYYINNYSPSGGRKIKEDGGTVNIADILENLEPIPILSSEAKPIGVRDGRTLLEVDTSKTYIMYKNTWYPL
jgi:hypothetical protein